MNLDGVLELILIANSYWTDGYLLIQLATLSKG